jgi:hypothetical protein
MDNEDVVSEVDTPVKIRRGAGTSISLKKQLSNGNIICGQKSQDQENFIEFLG